MAKVIARIQLAKGETGYYDEKSGIFLNWSHPIADVMEGTDCSGLRVSQRCRRIKVLSGSLGKAKSLKRILAESKAKRLGVPVEHVLHKGKKMAVYVKDDTPQETSTVKKDKKPEPEEVKAEAPAEIKTSEEKPVVEEASADEVQTEDVVEETEDASAADEAPADEPKAEEKPKKTTRRRRTKKAAADEK